MSYLTNLLNPALTRSKMMRRLFASRQMIDFHAHLDSQIQEKAYLCNTKGFGTHGGCMALHVGDWDMRKGFVIDDSRKVVVDVV